MEPLLSNQKSEPNMLKFPSKFIRTLNNCEKIDQRTAIQSSDKIKLNPNANSRTQPNADLFGNANLSIELNQWSN